MKKFVPLFALGMFSLSVASGQTAATPKSTIVVIPGSWSSAADWGYVQAALKPSGQEVIVVNLPGHGNDKTPVSSINLASYVATVKKAIGNRNNITLVAHSFGGVVATQVAEEIHSQIKSVVFVAAYVPLNGESLLSLATADGDSHLGKVLQIKEAEGQAIVPASGVVDAFFADAPQQVKDYAPLHFPVEPLAPLAEPVQTTAGNFGKLSKVYVFTANDHTNSPSLQHKMVGNHGIERTYQLPSSHTPFVSMPAVLAAILAQEAGR